MTQEHVQSAAGQMFNFTFASGKVIHALRHELVRLVGSASESAYPVT